MPASSWFLLDRRVESNRRVKSSWLIQPILLCESSLQETEVKLTLVQAFDYGTDVLRIL